MSPQSGASPVLQRRAPRCSERTLCARPRPPDPVRCWTGFCKDRPGFAGWGACLLARGWAWCLAGPWCQVGAWCLAGAHCLAGALFCF